MKLINQSLSYLSVSIFVIITLWAVVFYFIMLDEIKGSIDEGLENQKRLIIKNAMLDQSIIDKKYFDESFFSIKEISKQEAINYRDKYIDKILMMQDADDLAPEPEPVRMLISSFKLENKYYELVVSNSMIEEEDLIAALFWNIVILYSSLIVGIILINNFMLRKVWRPFYDYLSQLKNYKLGTYQKTPAVETNSTEFNDMQNAVKSMINYSLVIFERQKQFIANASHELQTPLAITTNKLELVLENGELKHKDAEKVVEVFQIIQSLIKLNKSLLLLSKIENKHYFDNKEISINAITKQSLSNFKELASFKNIDISVSFETELKINADRTLIAIVINNLLKNAILHNIDNGKIKIRILKNCFEISNTSSYLAMNNSNLYNRFQKNQQQTNGSGLGLAITKAIIDLYSFNISYQFDNATHCFKISFH